MASDSARDVPNRVDRFVIIVHPCPYEIYFKPTPDSPHFAYRQREIQVHRQWLRAVEHLDAATTFVVQIDMPDTATGPDELHAACVRRLGAARVCRVPGEYQHANE